MESNFAPAFRLRFVLQFQEKKEKNQKKEKKEKKEGLCNKGDQHCPQKGS
jgi:hypothetical protein